MKLAAVYFSLVISCFLLCGCRALNETKTRSTLERIQISNDGRHFLKKNSGCAFQPWGFNYDHDTDGRLIEDYWIKEWHAVEEDFEQIKSLGANVVRVHLQTGRFMETAVKPNPNSLQRLSMLVKLAEIKELYLDLTGLGCYHKEDVPAWYDSLNEAERWNVQARFWEAVSKTCAGSPAVFCYDLMNEPVVTSGDTIQNSWLAGEPFAGSYFVQRINLEGRGRQPEEIACQWAAKLTAAIRKNDPDGLITVGVIPWALTWPNAKSLFYSPAVSEYFDFVSVHFYPQKGQIEKALDALRVYDIGKPLVIEEMFSLSCGIDELDTFIDGSRSMADGWIGFFWGKGIDDYKAILADLKKQNITQDNVNKAISNALILQWLEYFAAKSHEMAVECP